jgi:hypothetical protein
MKIVINCILSAFLAAVPGAAFLVATGLATLQNGGLYYAFVGAWVLLVSVLIYVRCAK